MRCRFSVFAVMWAGLVLGTAVGCGDDDDGQVSLDGGSQPETLSQIQSRWASERGDRALGVGASVDLTGSPLLLSAEGKARIDAPGVLRPEPVFSSDPRYVFFAEAQVGTETGVLVLEGERISLTGGTLGDVGTVLATARTHLEDGGVAPAVELKLAYDPSLSDPVVTFPDDWSKAKSGLFFSDPVAVQVSNASFTGFARGVLLTATGSTPITGSVTVTSASRMFWDDSSTLEVAASKVDCTRFSLGGVVDGGSLTSADLQAAPPLPEAVNGRAARVVLQPGHARSEGEVRLTQAVTQQGPLVQADVELAFDTKPLTVKKNERVLLPVVFRERSLRGDAVLSDLQVTGTGKDVVHVPLQNPPLVVERLWKEVTDAGLFVTFAAAVPLAILSPFIALGDLLGCLFSTCPQPYPIWMDAGTVSRFHVIVEGKLPPGSYEAEVTLVGRNHASLKVPVQFTVTE